MAADIGVGMAFIHACLFVCLLLDKIKTVRNFISNIVVYTVHVTVYVHA